MRLGMQDARKNHLGLFESRPALNDWKTLFVPYVSLILRLTDKIFAKCGKKVDERYENLIFPRLSANLVGFTSIQYKKRTNGQKQLIYLVACNSAAQNKADKEVVNLSGTKINRKQTTTYPDPARPKPDPPRPKPDPCPTRARPAPTRARPSPTRARPGPTQARPGTEPALARRMRTTMHGKLRIRRFWGTIPLRRHIGWVCDMSRDKD